MEHLSGMKDALETKKKKVAPKHEAHKEETKKAHGFHAKKVKGGWHVHHHDEEDKPIKGAEHVMPDMDAMHDHMESQFGEPNEGEPQADAGQHGVPEAMAQSAGLPPMPGQGA